MIRFRTLGTLDLRADDDLPVRSVLTQPRRTALLAYLAGALPHDFRRKDTLYALFWPERDTDSARHALRQAVYFLRRALGEDVVLTRGGLELGLSAQRFWCDAAAFEQAVIEDRIEDALELYRGDLLEGFFVDRAPAFERWLEEERARLRDLAATAGWLLAERLEQAGDAAGAARMGRRALGLAPADEVALRRLLGLLDRSGDRAAAVRTYDEFVARLREDYDLEPAAETIALMEAIRAGATQAAAGPVAAGGTRSANTELAVAVFPFADEDADGARSLSEPLAQLLSADLHGTWLRPLESRTVRDAAAADGGLAHPDVARRVATHLGAGGFVLGSIVRAGGRVRAMATLYDDAGRQAGLADAVVDGEEKLFELSADLARQLLAEHWDEGSDLSRTARHLTLSVTALGEFYDGERHFRAARLGRAIDAYRRAVAADPGFVTAWMRMAFVGAWALQADASDQAAARASALAGRLPHPEATLLAALLALLDGDSALAEDRFRGLLEIYPESADGWAGLGFVQLVSNPLRGRTIAEVRLSCEQACHVGPQHLYPLVPLAYIAARERRYDDFRELMRRLGPDQDFAPLMRVTAAFAAGDDHARAEQLAALRTLPDLAVHEAARYTAHLTPDLEAAAQIARILTEPSRLPEVRATGHVVAAHVELARGRRVAAAAEVDAARELDPDMGLEHAALFATLPFLAARPADLRALRSEIDGRLEAGPPATPRPRTPFALHDAIRTEAWTYLRGLLSARLGDAQAALDAARALEQDPRADPPGPLVRDLGRGVRSYLAEAQGQLPKALDILTGAELKRPLRDVMFQSPFYSSFLERYRRGHLLVALGRPDEARPWLEMIAESSVYGQAYEPAARRLLQAGRTPAPAGG